MIYIFIVDPWEKENKIFEFIFTIYVIVFKGYNTYKFIII